MLAPSLPPPAAPGRLYRPRAILLGQSPQLLLAAKPKRLGAWVYHNGGQLEVPVPLPLSGAGNQLALAKFIDSAGIAVPPSAFSTYKSLYLVVDVAFAWVTGAQATIQLVVGRQPWPALSGAATGVGAAAGAYNALKGNAANLGGAAATSLAVGVYAFSPADIGDLQWHHPYLGVEITLGSALTAGAARLLLQMPGAPSLYVGEDMEMSPSIGDTGGSFVINAQGPPMWIPGGQEFYAMAGPGGPVDCRVWEVYQDDQGRVA